MEYTIWDAATGIILRSGTSSRPDLQPGEGERVIAGKALDGTKYRIDVETEEEYEWTPPATADELRIAINRERDRRIEAGRFFDGVHVTGRDRDQLNLLALKDTARDLKAAGITAAIIPFRDGADVIHMLTADQIIDLADDGKVYVSAVYQASWALKEMDPIPQDVTDDQYWPAAS